MRTFRERYCAQRRIPLDRFQAELVGRALPWQARPVYWLLSFSQDYTAPDHEFVQGVGELRDRREFSTEAAAFRSHPRNRGLLRSLLKLRVSSRRLRAIFEPLMEDQGRPPAS